MRALLQKTIIGEWFDDYVYSSNQPLLDLGVQVIPFDESKSKGIFRSNKFNAFTDIVIGSVESCVMFFEACGIETPKYIGYPDELKKFLYRDVKTCKVKDLDDDKFPYFIKPMDDVKLFTGTTVANKNQLRLFKEQHIIRTPGLKDMHPINPDAMLYVTDAINIQSEFRCFVHKGKLKGIQYYAGDFTKFPDAMEISKMINAYKSANVSYTLDVGVVYTKGGSTVTALIEVNDMWAIAGYGFDPKQYVRMTIDRFQEIARNAKRIELNHNPWPKITD